jgi:hypothetical protein
LNIQSIEPGADASGRRRRWGRDDEQQADEGEQPLENGQMDPPNLLEYSCSIEFY